MKPDAPEKIYLIRNISTPTSLNTTNDCHEEYLQEWYKEREKDADIEYTRTDILQPGVDGSDGASLIMKERQRQIEVEGFDENHDARENINSLISAAIAYAVASRQNPDKWTAKDWWPWDAKWWKPTTRKRNLEKAGALIAAAIDKLQIENNNS